MVISCLCACHHGPQYPCDQPGGCGHLHQHDTPLTTREAAALLGAQPPPPEPARPLAPPARGPIVLNPVSGEHRCYRGHRCAQADPHEQIVCTTGCPCHTTGGRCPTPCAPTHRKETTRVGGQIMAARGLCVTCTRTLTDAITELPRDYVELHLALERGAAALSELVSATKDLPAALRVNVAALAAEIVRVAEAWAEPAAERLGITWDSTRMGRHTRPGYILQRATHILALHIPVLLALRGVEIQVWAANGWYRSFEPTDGLDGALRMLHLHHLTRATLGHTKLVHQLPAPCPHCGAMALVRDDGDGNVHCQRCRLQWPETDYRRLTLVLAADYELPPLPLRTDRPRSGARGTIARPVTREALTR